MDGWRGIHQVQTIGWSVVLVAYMRGHITTNPIAPLVSLLAALLDGCADRWFGSCTYSRDGQKMPDYGRGGSSGESNALVERGESCLDFVLAH
jgi:hypothetical protein